MTELAQEEWIIIAYFAGIAIGILGCLAVQNMFAQHKRDKKSGLYRRIAERWGK